MTSLGKALRLNRILKGPDRKALVVAFDHGGILGPIPGTLDPAQKIRAFVEGGVDGVLLNPGLLRLCADSFVGRACPALIVRLDWTNAWTTRVGSGDFQSALLTRAEDALRAGADAVMTYLFLGAGDARFEAAEMERNAVVARECERLGMPLIIEAITKTEGGHSGNVEHAMARTRIAAELGADAIKTEYTGDAESMRRVVKACPIPILALGGQKLPDEANMLDMVRGIVRSGVAGIIFGRNVFQSENMPELLKTLRGLLNA